MIIETECPLCGAPIWDDEEMCVSCTETLLEDEAEDNGPKD